MTSYSNALVGYTGYVGSNILEQESFSFLYNSKNIHQINDKYFDLSFAQVLRAEWVPINMRMQIIEQ